MSSGLASAPVGANRSLQTEFSPGGSHPSSFDDCLLYAIATLGSLRVWPKRAIEMRGQAALSIGGRAERIGLHRPGPSGGARSGGTQG